MRSLRISLTALTLTLACTTGKMEQGTIFTASTVLIGASQTPTRDAAVYVSDGRIQEVGLAANIRLAMRRSRS